MTIVFNTATWGLAYLWLGGSEWAGNILVWLYGVLSFLMVLTMLFLDENARENLRKEYESNKTLKHFLLVNRFAVSILFATQGHFVIATVVFLHMLFSASVYKGR